MPRFESKMLVGLIIARSVDVPSPADAITYTVQVEDQDGVVTYGGVAPQDHYRLSSVFSVDLMPFEVGQRVPIGVSHFGATEYIDIMAGELPSVGPCP